MLRILAAIGCLALLGCVESPVPLESGGRVSDPRLIGVWKTDFDGDPMVAIIRPQGSGLVADVQAYSEPGPKAATTRYEIVLAQFGERRYMSIKDPKLSPTWAIAGYEFEGKDRWCLHPVPSEALAADLESKALPGAIKPDRHLTTVELSATSEQLRKYFAEHGARVFDDHPLMGFGKTASAVLPPPQTQEDRDRGDPGFDEVKPCNGSALQD
jgi:hypothetical protein